MTHPAPSMDFRALFEALPGAYLILDLDYVVVAASDAYMASIESGRDRFVGRKLFELMPVEASDDSRASYAVLRASFDRVAATGRTEVLPAQRYEVRRSPKQGGGIRLGYLSVVNKAMRDQAGEVCWLIHRVHDVTESQVALTSRDAAEEARLALERQHALALAASGLGSWTYDRDTDALSWDERAKVLLGFTPDNAVSFADFFTRIHPEDRPEVRRRTDELLASEGPNELTITYRTLETEGVPARWLEARGRATFSDGVCVRISGVLADVTEPRRHEAHLRLLINELNHRVKNTLAVVQSIAMRTLRDDVEPLEARERFLNRLMALAAAHDILTRESWDGADLADLAERVLAPYRTGGAERIEIKGPATRVSPRVALSVAMALHELATNAVKYGALSDPAGAVAVHWGLDGTCAEETLKLAWVERGGPPVSAPTRKGFGLRLLERVLAEDIGGTVAVDFAPLGLTCSISAPASAWRSAADSEPLGTV